MKKAVCALILDSNNKILSVTRKNNHDDWGLPGGKLDEDETFQVALIREVLEETGHHVNIKDKDNYFEDIDGDFLVRTYPCDILSKSILNLDPSETGKVSYIDSQELLKGSFKDYNLKCFAYYNSSILYQKEDIIFEG